MLLISACGHVETKSFTYTTLERGEAKADLGLRYVDGLLWKLHIKYSTPELVFGTPDSLMKIHLMSSDGFKLIEIDVSNSENPHILNDPDCNGWGLNSLECAGKVENVSRETFSLIEQFKITHLDLYKLRK